MRLGSIAALIASTLTCTVHAQTQSAAIPTELQQAMLLHATFDSNLNADFGKGDKKLYTTKSTELTDPVVGLQGTEIVHDKTGGRTGGCLHFTKKSPSFPFFKGEGNVPMPKKGEPFSGTFSFWMKLDPVKDLSPGFVDPIQITDKKWNDASFFLDFTKDNPRQFRLGAYSNYKHWNPKALKYDDIPDSKRPLGAITKLPFSNQKWTHVTFTWDKFNTGKPADAVMYIDGKPAAKVKWDQQYDWDPKKVGIMLGINYGGRIDEVSVFNKALSARELQLLFRSPAAATK